MTPHSSNIMKVKHKEHLIDKKSETQTYKERNREKERRKKERSREIERDR